VLFSRGGSRVGELRDRLPLKVHRQRQRAEARQPGGTDRGPDLVADIWLLRWWGQSYARAAVLYDTATNGRDTKVPTAIGLAIWKRDRFVSADAPATGGTLTTVPLRLAGKRLEVNAVTKGKGEVRVELLDAAGWSLKGFQPSAPISGASLRPAVAFHGGADLAALVGCGESGLRLILIECAG
jgi:hypothetical protein